MLLTVLEVQSNGVSQQCCFISAGGGLLQPGWTGPRIIGKCPCHSILTLHLLCSNHQSSPQALTFSLQKQAAAPATSMSMLMPLQAAHATCNCSHPSQQVAAPPSMDKSCVLPCSRLLHARQLRKRPDQRALLLALLRLLCPSEGAIVKFRSMLRVMCTALWDGIQQLNPFLHIVAPPARTWR